MGALPCTRASPAAVGFDRWKPPDPTSASLPILLLGLRFLPQGWGVRDPPRTPCTLSQAPSHGEGFAFSVCFRALQSPHCPAFPVGLGELAGMGGPCECERPVPSLLPLLPRHGRAGRGTRAVPSRVHGPRHCPHAQQRRHCSSQDGDGSLQPPGVGKRSRGCLWGPAPGWDSW